MKFEFTIKDLEVETFNRVSLGRIKKLFAEYAGKRIGVYDYSIARSDDSVSEYTVVFRILKPRYQIVAIDRVGVQRHYIDDYVYTNLHDAQFKYERLIKEQSEKNLKPRYELEYEIEPIYYLDKKI